jgi:hypothetical protein
MILLEMKDNDPVSPTTIDLFDNKEKYVRASFKLKFREIVTLWKRYLFNKRNDNATN